MSDFERFVAYLKFMGIKLDADSFDSRIRMQKLAYLLGMLSGKEFTKDFSTYVRGPYSRELADYYYGKKGHQKKEVDIDEKFKKELTRVSFAKTLTTKQLEIMATLQRFEELGNDEERAIKKLQETKPYFTLGEIMNGLGLLKEFMLTDADRKRLLAAMKEEFDLYDNVVGDRLIEQ